MPTKNDILIGQLLVRENIITSQQLEEGLSQQKKKGSFICATLVSMGLTQEEKIYSILSRQLNIPYVNIREKNIPLEAIQKVPAKFSSHYHIIPLELKDGCLLVAMTDPLDVRVLDDLKLILGVDVKGVLSSEEQIGEAIGKYYGIGAETAEKIISQALPADETAVSQQIEDLEALAEDASVIKFVNQILSEAIKSRATDVHFEPYQNELRARFRVDGLLYDVNIPDTMKYFHPAIVSRIKIMASLNIAERRLPQEGRIKIRIDGRELDLRISMIPTIFGESVQIRILNPGFFLNLDNLGLSQEELSDISKIISRTHGIVFVTGPTGSGKTTTLYASLSHINSDNVKIITIEDPVEYQLRGVNQIQINPKIGLVFSTALKNILRHDPDVMMVGEVRDRETADIAIRSALTGHLVFSTLHTNDAAGAVTRLLDMGVEPFLISSSLECVIAQRLVRVVCPECKAQIHPEKKLINLMESLPIDLSKIKFYEGKGCRNCRFSGYLGRTGIYEILKINEDIRKLILARASSQQIKQAALSQGMRTLRQSGLNKISEGVTTFFEVLRVTQQEDLS